MDYEREWDEYEEPKETLPEENNNEERYPSTPYTASEQRRIMGDVYRSLTSARDQGDEARTYYTQEAINALQ